jgi:hypothetical protein
VITTFDVVVTGLECFGEVGERHPPADQPAEPAEVGVEECLRRLRVVRR